MSRPGEEPGPGEPFVALAESKGRFLQAYPFFRRGPAVSLDRGGKARPGRLALVAQRAKGRRTKAKVLRELGSPDNARDVIEALMLDRGLRLHFPKKVEEAADRAVASPFDDPTRKDLRELPTFTIDPSTARDFDDAISAERMENGHVRVWVHIADVSAYVRPGDPVDREAYRRATSVYVPGMVEPMLPEQLSNGACSLVPGEDRLAVTAEMEFRGVEMVKATFARTLIRSDMRLTYEEVDEIFDGEREAQEPWATPLGLCRALADSLEARRREGAGALAIETSEPEFAFSRKGHVTDATASVQTESHLLIEHMMISANEAVARLCAEKGIPTLYRVHEKPEGEAVEALLDQLASLDVATPPAPKRISRTEAAEIVAQASLAVDQHVKRTGHGRTGLTYRILRALQQARYFPENLGHAGLGLEHYCHFTSPIRRYPDLLTHRALLSAIGAGEEAPDAAQLEEDATWCSEREREAMVVERDADAIARAFLLERVWHERGVDTPFAGEVTGVIGAGAFVAFDDGAFEGFMPVRKIRGDWWELNEQGTILVGTRSGGAIRLGDRVEVVVERVDTARGRVDLLPVEPENRR